MKFVYVILHYFSADDTISCVNSILDNVRDSKNDSKYIIIVDNGSPNDSFNEVKRTLEDKKNIIYIKSEKNLGFAKGNNLGFLYAKEKISPDFIIVINNDTEIRQESFQNVIVEKYKRYSFYILGPDIVTLDGFHQNPGDKQCWSKMELRKFRIKRRVENLLLNLKLYKIRKRLVKPKENVYHKFSIESDIENTILHGACLIFSKEYITQFNGFYDKTFMYMEEDILKLMSDYYNYLMLYTPDIKIFHKEEAASKLIYSNDSKRLVQKNKMLIESTFVYESLMKEFKEGKFK